MPVDLVPYDSASHDENVVSQLCLEAEPEMYTAMLGNRELALRLIRELMRSTKENWYTRPNLWCIMRNGRTAGVVAYFDTARKDELDRSAGMVFIRRLGLLATIRRIPGMLRMRRLVWRRFHSPGIYVHALAVDEKHRSAGLGSFAMALLAEQHGRIYLDANMANERALAFYEREGFEVKASNVARIHGRTIGTHSLERPPSAG